MQLIKHALIGYFVPLPIYLVLAAYSLRYYATLPNISERSIDSFLWLVRWPLRGFYAEYSKYNLLTQNPNTSLSAYLKTEPHLMSTLRRYNVGIGAIMFIFAFIVSFTKQTENSWRIEHILLILANVLTFIWAWRFGSKLIQIENSPQ